MSFKLSLPSKKESTILIILTVIFTLFTAIFVGLRSEHIYLIGFYLLLFFVSEPSRKLAVGLLPFLIFGMSYDWMRVLPNYMVNPVDVKGLYDLEISLFGVIENGVKITPCEFFATHTSKIADLFAGIFYFGWVPVPIAFAIYLYLKGERRLFLRFSMAFLVVNLLGFTIYYIYPAAPPWYAMYYGFEPILDTPGNMAGLSRFDDLIGFPLFSSIYGRNANVFAAVPSLHSAYLLIVLYYAVVRKSGWLLLVIVTLFLFGIWFTAVYTAHHYIVDVLLGILCAIVGIVIFEGILMRLSFFKSFFNNYFNYIKA